MGTSIIIRDLVRLICNVPMTQSPPIDPKVPDSRRGALMGLLVIVLLVVGGLLLVHALRHMSEIQDCAMSGRTNCAPIDASAPGR
jgi:hypothetical protein